MIIQITAASDWPHLCLHRCFALNYNGYRRILHLGLVKFFDLGCRGRITCIKMHTKLYQDLHHTIFTKLFQQHCDQLTHSVAVSQNIARTYVV